MFRMDGHDGYIVSRTVFVCWRSLTDYRFFSGLTNTEDGVIYRDYITDDFGNLVEVWP